jgi:sugar/nucleoside kinase (ribokinase family)
VSVTPVNAAPGLVCVGRIVREMIYFPGETRGPVLGSPPAYCSVAAARQGTRTGIVTKIGPEMPPYLLQPIIEAGVDTAGLLVSEHCTCSELIYDENGEKEIRYPSFSDPITATDIPQSYQGCGILYVCTMDNDVLLPDLAGVVAAGQISAVDLGGYGGVHMSLRNRKAVASLPRLAADVSSHFDIVKASDEDAASIFGAHDAKAAARQLLDCGPQVVVITLGKDGALVCTREKAWHVPAVPGKPVDTTGGGDTFMAGFLTEYLRSGDPLRAARWGCATAMWVIEWSGGVRLERMPPFQQVEERVRNSYH